MVGVRLLLSTRSAYGHLYPMMPLAEAARAAGHEVVFSIGPEFVAKLEGLGYAPMRPASRSQAGAEAVAAGTPVAGVDGRTNLDFGAHVFVDVMARRVVDDVAPVLADVEPDVVVYGQFDPGAGVAAARRVSPSSVTPFRRIGRSRRRGRRTRSGWPVCAPTAASPLAVTGSWATPTRCGVPVRARGTLVLRSPRPVADATRRLDGTGCERADVGRARAVGRSCT